MRADRAGFLNGRASHLPVGLSLMLLQKQRKEFVKKVACSRNISTAVVDKRKSCDTAQAAYPTRSKHTPWTRQHNTAPHYAIHPPTSPHPAPRHLPPVWRFPLGLSRTGGRGRPAHLPQRWTIPQLPPRQRCSARDTKRITRDATICVQASLPGRHRPPRTWE